MGRPTVMTVEKLSELKEAFAMGLNDLEACNYVGIADKTLDNYEKTHPEFIRIKECLRSSTLTQAKINIHKSIKVHKDTGTSKWYAEKRDKDFQPTQKTEVIINGFGDLVSAINDASAKRFD